MRAGLWLICAMALAAPALAQDIGPRPQPRPQMAQAAQALPAAQIPQPSLKPLARPNLDAPAVAEVPAGQVTLRPMQRPASSAPVLADAPPIAASIARSPRPMPRPKALTEAAAAVAAAPANTAAPQGGTADNTPSKPNLIQLLFGAGGAAKVPQDQASREVASAAPPPRASTNSSNAPRKGSVCGDRAIRGEEIKPITSKVQGCGVANPVRVTEVAGIKLTQAVTVECDTVIALRQWIDTAMRPAFGARDVTQLRIAAHYACRGRNNQRGARISEHGKGRALDISGFIFADGREWTIARDYNKQILAAHKGACGIFGTTLGPGSDGFHEDHLHFDIARYRSGPYCR